MTFSRRLWAKTRAAVRCLIFTVAMIPARRQPVHWLTRRPRIDRISVPTRAGPVEVLLYRPRSRGPHAGVVTSFGVNPSGLMDPRVPQMGDALARAGFATLLFWPPTARDLAIEREDVLELISAFRALVRQPFVDADRSGFTGICVGGALALIAAADPEIRDQVSFVCAYAPFSSMRTLAIDIASGTRTLGDVREPWEVDPLTWTVYVRTVTDWLTLDEADRLQNAYGGCVSWNPTKTVVLHAPPGFVDQAQLSADGRAALRLLAADAGDVEAALDQLPPTAVSTLEEMSPINHVGGLTAAVTILHDRFDHVIPVGESRRLWAALAGRPGCTYTELGLQHLRMPSGIPGRQVLREIARSYLAWYPLFEQTTPASRRRST